VPDDTRTSLRGHSKGGGGGGGGGSVGVVGAVGVVGGGVVGGTGVGSSSPPQAANATMDTTSTMANKTNNALGFTVSPP